jgi:UDP-N-acetylmuramate dehydrogenase
MKDPIQSAVSLRPFNTFGVEAKAAFFAAVRSVDQLRELLAEPRVRDLPRLILGGGSNILFTRDFEGLVIRIDIPGYARAGGDEDHHLVHVGAGEGWHATVERLLDDGLPGVENLALIPGSVGAAPIQNIGAYGVELAERLRAVEAFDPASDSVQVLDAEACGFGYRDSVFKQRPSDGRIVVGVTLALPRRWTPVVGYADVEHELGVRGVARPSPRDVFDAVVAIRTRKLPDPKEIGNAGSFFKNPVVSRARRQELVDRFPSMVNYDIGGGRYKLAAGWLIEACGLKGAVRGRAGVYPRQALVLVNLGGATGADVLAMAREVQDAVFARFGVELEPEPTVL